MVELLTYNQFGIKSLKTRRPKKLKGAVKTNEEKGEVNKETKKKESKEDFDVEDILQWVE